MVKRIKISQSTKLQLWTEAAGRCQFRGCNKELWYNDLTLNKRNFGKMAHIIGASDKGPRGNQLSEELAKDPSNIMLLCSRCHDEIDDSILMNLYSPDDLRQMKAEHSNRVRMLLEQKGKKTRPVILTSQIGRQNVAFSNRSIKSAILPNYPDRISDDWFKIEIGSFDRTDLSAWKVALDKINETVDSINRSCQNGSIEHLSLFGITAQPLLMYLGRMLGDKISMQIFEPRRTDDPDKKWSWEEDDGISIQYFVSRIKKGIDRNVILLLALSDNLGDDKYGRMLSGNPYVYQLTIKNPVQGFLTKKSEKSIFIQSCRALLNQIQKEVGKDCIIHVFPAMPASLAVEFGRMLQPTKDPKIWVYENINGIGPEKIIELI